MIMERTFNNLSSNFTHNNEYNRAFLVNQLQYFSNLLETRGHVFVNEVYDALGFSRTVQGQLNGWIKRDNRCRNIFELKGNVNHLDIKIIFYTDGEILNVLK